MKRMMVVLAFAGFVGGLAACTVTTSGHVRTEISTGQSIQHNADTAR
ncbi:MAG: hypothetical protein JJU21_17470 [Salinarimonas sp.]|nr:hypothetical protein [Salinarimonas sp.]